MSNIKFPRVIVSPARLEKLRAEAAKRSKGGKKISIAQVAEEKFKLAK